MSFSPLQLILIGFVLALSGVVLPLLMVLRVLDSTFFLNFASFTANLSGLLLGLLGAASYVRGRQK